MYYLYVVADHFSVIKVSISIIQAYLLQDSVTLQFFSFYSCALFILVVSEALQGEGDVNANVDLSGLHNVSNKAAGIDKNVPTSIPNENQGAEGADIDTPPPLHDQEMIFAETLSLNSVTTDG